MKTKWSSLLTGALAGFTSALLVLAAMNHLSFSTLFLILAGIPVFIAGLSFGVAASLASLVASFLTLGALVAPGFAFTILILPQIPVAWMAYQANLARPASEIGGPDNVTAWYPLSDMLLHLSGLTAVMQCVLLLYSGYDLETTTELVKQAWVSMAANNPELDLTPEEIQRAAGFYYYLLPVMQGLMSVITIFASYYFSALIVRMSTRSLRPREDMPSALRMHRLGILPFAVGIALLFIGGPAAIAGAAFCGAFGGGFLLSGLASFHLMTRGKPWRTPALWLAYITIFASAVLFIALGIVDSRRAVALTPEDHSNSDNH